MYILPKRPSSKALLTSCILGLRRFWSTTNSFTPASSQAFISSSASFRRQAMGFSVSTCLLALAAWMPCSGCRPEGVQMEIRSMSSLLSISSYLVVQKGILYFSAASLARSGIMSQQATTWASFCWAMASKWFFEIRPQPSNPILIMVF